MRHRLLQGSVAGILASALLLLAWGSAYGAKASCCKTACLCELVHKAAAQAKAACGLSAARSCALRGADANGALAPAAQELADPAVVSWAIFLFLLIAADRRWRRSRQEGRAAPFLGVPHPPPWRRLSV